MFSSAPGLFIRIHLLRYSAGGNKSGKTNVVDKKVRQGKREKGYHSPFSTWKGEKRMGKCFS